MQTPNKKRQAFLRSKRSNVGLFFDVSLVEGVELIEKHQENKPFGFFEIEISESTAELPKTAIPKAYLAVENASEQAVQCALYFLNDFSGMLRIFLKIHIVHIKN